MPSKQYYTVVEANAQVPRLNELFSSVMQLRAHLKGIYQRLDEAGHAPSSEEDLEADDDAPPEVERDRLVFKGMADTLKEQVQDILDSGCVIKDIESGLVDWPALHDGRPIWLCWKYGEREVGWWHDEEAGFAGRQPVELLQGRTYGARRERAPFGADSEYDSDLDPAYDDGDDPGTPHRY